MRRPVAARVADFEPHPWTGALKEVPVWEPPEETDPDPVTGAIPRWQPVVTGAIPIVPAPAGGFGSLRSPTEPVRFDAPDFAGTAPASQLPARHDPDFDDVIGGRAGGSYPDGADRDDPDWVDEDEPRDLRLLHYLVLVVLAIVLGLVVWRFGFDSSATDPEPTAPASSVEDDSGIVPGSDSSG